MSDLENVKNLENINNSEEEAEAAILTAIHESIYGIDLEKFYPHIEKVFEAVATEKLPVTISLDEQLLCSLIPAQDFFDYTAFMQSQAGEQTPDLPYSKVGDIYELLDSGFPGTIFENPKMQTLVGFSYAVSDTNDGAVLSVFEPGVPEVVLADPDMIEELAAFFEVRGQVEAERRIKEAADDPSFIVPLPPEFYEGVELPLDDNGNPVTPMGHIGFVMEYQELKDRADAGDEEAKADVQGLIDGFRGILKGSLVGEPLEP